MDKGWIKLHRQFLEWEWYDEPNCLRLFIHCLLRANHKDNKYRGDLIKRGTFVTSYDTLAFELNISKQSLRTALGKLKKTGEINTQTNTRGTLVTICNYDTYQSDEPETNTRSNTRATHKQHAINTQLTTNKKEKNEKNEKNVRNIPTLYDVQEYFKQTNKIQNSHIELEAENFINHYESLEWKRNGKNIKNWKLQASTWANNYLKFNPVVRNIHDNPFN